MKGKKISLKWRIFASFSAFLVILLALLWLCQTVFLNSFYKAVKVGETKSAVKTVSANVESEKLEYIVASFGNDKDISLTVLDSEGNVICSAKGKNNRSMFDSIPDDALSEFYSKAKTGGGEYSEYSSGKLFSDIKAPDKNTDAQKPDTFSDDDSDKEQSRPNSFLICKIVYTQNSNYTVIANASIMPVDSVVSTLRVILIAVTVLTVLGAFVVAILMSSSLTKPIKNISEKAEELSKGDYEVEFEGSNIKEIDELSDSLNHTKTELGKIDALQKELVANISHDLRTPLTLIGGYAEVMRDIPGEATEENLQVIIDETKRLSSLVTDVLDISKFNSGSQQMEFEPVDLVECVKSVIPRYNKLVESEDYKIEFTSNVEHAFVKADSTRMLQVVYNLINNAVSYTGEDKTVRIEITAQNGKVAVHIIDSGEGIPEDKLPYIWDRYYKVEKNHRRAQMGSGLGLSIVKEILLAHGAAFGVSSKEGEGSDFWFEMKLEPQE